MATKKKRQTVKELNHLFTDSQVLIFTDYRGLTVSDINHLRRQLRDKGVEYHVTKNSLATLAASRAGMEQMTDMLDGPTAIAFVNDDIPGAAKVLSDFVRSSKILRIRGGLMGSSVLNEYEVGELTKIKSREEYLAQLFGSMRAPIQNFVNVLNAPLQNFVNVLNARLDQIKEGGETAETVETVETVETAPVSVEMAETAEATPVGAETVEAAPASAETAETEAAPAGDETPETAPESDETAEGTQAGDEA
jgi:large subunit ribosomal protein L10